MSEDDSSSSAIAALLTIPVAIAALLEALIPLLIVGIMFVMLL